MSDQSKGKRRVAGWVSAAALLAAGAVGGGMLATTVSASAESTATPSTANSASAGGTAGQDHRGAKPVRSDEQSVSSADEAKLRAAALKAVPGGTVYRVETDAGDGEYEAHMTKADGTEVTVKFDKNLAVTQVENGMGAGDPAPAR